MDIIVCIIAVLAGIGCIMKRKVLAIINADIQAQTFNYRYGEREKRWTPVMIAAIGLVSAVWGAYNLALIFFF
jgi:hypothetical protein